MNNASGGKYVKEQKSDRRWLYVNAAALLILVLGILALSFFYVQARGKDRASGPKAELSQIEGIVRRGLGRINLRDGQENWVFQIANGQTGLDHFLLRLFVSPAYLAGGVSDLQFVEDLFFIVNGEALSSDLSLEFFAQLPLEADRRTWINLILKDSGYSANLPQDGTGGSSKTNLIGVLPEADTEIVGRLQIDLTAGTDPKAVRLYANGKIYDRAEALSAAAAGTANMSLVWDTTDLAPGAYDLALLAIDQGGRGEWLDLNSLKVPQIETLSLSEVRPLADSGWFLVDPDDEGVIRLLALESATKIDLTLYANWDRKLTHTRVLPGQTGALFFAAGEDETCYVHLTSEEDETPDCTLVVSARAALAGDDPTTVLSVIDSTKQRIRVQDAAGQRLEFLPEELILIDPAARLAMLDLSFPDGTATGYLPVFLADHEQYALYVPQETQTLSYQFAAMEGDAAEVEVVFKQKDNKEQTMPHSGELPLSDDLNRLKIRVRGFDGAEKTYSVQILRPPAADGFDRMLEPFPADWRTPLFWIHTLYPGYRFVADQTGIDWADFLKAQDSDARSLIDASFVPADWVKPDSPVYDAANWKAAAVQVIAHYGDPRNFLNPTDLFQFEKLTFSEQLHTEEGVRQILKGSFMDQASGETDFASLILQAGQEADISPFFLASRIIQEMGLSAQSPLATGTLSGYEGVFNFYNIGAYPNPDVPNGAQINGARFALFGNNPQAGDLSDEEIGWLLPWTSPQRAIVGGARWIAGQYVAIGQDTLFAQKFDLVAQDGLYLHQYAQNIQMAWAEGRRTRRNWAELDLMAEPFVFRIPVFDNMPSVPWPLPGE